MERWYLVLKAAHGLRVVDLDPVHLLQQLRLDVLDLEQSLVHILHGVSEAEPLAASAQREQLVPDDHPDLVPGPGAHADVPK